MNVRDILAELSRAGVKLRPDGDKLDIRAPRGAITPEMRTVLSEQKAELLELLRSNGHAHAGAPTVAVPDLEHRYDPFPMTEIEQAYWVGRRGAEGGVAMHAYFEIDCPDWDRARFEGAWNSLVSRHEMLRAVALPDGQRRILERTPRYEIEVEDLRGLGAEAVEERLLAIRDRLAHQVLPLDRWPLFEVRAAQLEAQLYRLFLSVDCTFIDAWSFQTLLRELIHLYKTPDAPLTPERIELSYRDYVLAAAGLRETEMYPRSLEYWRERARTLPPAPELPRVKTPALLGQLRFRRFAGRLDAAARSRLRDRAASHGLTLPGLLLAAYAEVLARWSRSPHFTLNVPLFNRQPIHPQVNSVVGTFSSFILVEVERRRGETFAERARRIQEQLWRDLEHRHVAGTEVLRELLRSRGGIESAMMPVVFTSFPSGADGRGCAWVDLVERELGAVRHVVTQTPQVWIDHHAVYEGDTLYFSWDVAIDLFPAGMLDDMFAAYESLLHSLADESAWLSATPIELSKGQVAERKRANDNRAPIPDRLLHAAFFDFARTQPDRPAVITTSCRLTYAELAHRARVVAQRLRDAGAAAHEPIAVVMEKGWEQVVGALGAMASGCPYLPVDPDVPEERLHYVLQNAAVRFVLTQARLEPFLKWPDGMVVLNVTAMDYTQPAAALAPVQNPDDLAVVIYTSGSTGRPNGVMLQHRGLVNAMEQTIQRFDLRPENRAFAITALHHDMSLFDLFGMLSCGGSLVIPDAHRRRDPSHWAELLRRERVTVWNSVPATMSMLVEYEGQRTDAAPALRMVFLGGDTMPVTLPDRIRALRPGVRVSNVGGPTETTLWNIWYPIGEVDPEWRSIPYGRPIPNTKYYILNEALEDCPVWVPGEICSSGIGTARGYLNNPEKTAAKFVTHPATGERIYRTGDWGRYLPDGNIDFMGRMDFQLAINGYRIEAGEIEAALLQHAAVKEAVVVACGEGVDKRLVAYVVAAADQSPSGEELRSVVAAKVPPYMVPRAYVFVDAFPLSPTGKLDRKALPPPPAAGAAPEPEAPAGDAEVERRLAEVVREVLGLKQVSTRENFFDLGANSVHLVQIHVKLKETWGIEIPILDLFQHPTIAVLARNIARRGQQPAPVVAVAAHRERQTGGGIAIVGMSGRFPGARNVEEFWRNLVEGKESVVFFTDEELRAAGIPAAMLRNPNYVKAGAPLEEIDRFDAAFFGMMPREAQNTDPQQRLFLECCWEALENAGCSPEQSMAAIGVYAGKTMSNYQYPNLADLTRPVHFFQSLIGNDKDYVATQVSYKFNLKGPSVAVQTACSTSLVAAAMACQALESGDCDVALAGGVSLKIPHRLGYLYEEGSVFSADGHCRVFDAKARGTVPGSGVGAVVLKRLADALADRDSIYAVVKGWALNNDGAHKVGFTAPSMEGQAAVIAAAQARAGVDAASITCVEGHGTGTPIGDPIEVAALTRAFRAGTDKRAYCALGSVKSNVGHLDAAAGVASLMKAALSLRHKTLPPSLHYEQPNPQIDFENSPFYVNARTAPWEANGTPRRAGVSSFGIGGTNAHLVLEEGPDVPASAGPQRPWNVLTLSAKSAPALEEMARRYSAFLASAADESFADICYSSNIGRMHFEHRLAAAAASAEDARSQLDAFLAGQIDNGPVRGAAALPAEPKVAFLFTGQGSQYAGMGRQLFESEPVFRQALEECDEILRPQLQPGLFEVLYPEAGRPSPIDEITYAQPVLFALEYALARLWRSWGVEPAVVMGHSTGEYVAACVAGVFSLADGLRLVAARGRLMETLALEGETLAVFAAEGKVTEALRPVASEISIAAINGPENIVVSGTHAAMEAVVATLAAEGIETKRLNIPRAAHSPLMEPMLAAFAEEADKVSYATPKIELISNLTGLPAAGDIATPGYWLRQVRRTVQFAAGIETLHRHGCQAYVEIGPKPTLIGMGQQCVPDAAALWLPSLRHGSEDLRQMLESLASLHASGAHVDWARLDAERRRRKVALPTYPFQRQRYWAESAGLLFGASSGTLHPLLGRKLSLALPNGERVFEAQLSQDDPEFLRHHRVFDTAILPAAAYLEMAFAAATAAGARGVLRLEDVLLEKALVLPEEGSRTAQCLLMPGKEDEYTFRISSLAAASDTAEAEWVGHASGKILVDGGGAVPDRVDLAALRAGFAEEIAIPDYYRQARAAGTNFGAPFQGIAQLWAKEGESLGRIELPAMLHAEAPDYALHPALLDACLQVIGTAFPPLGADETFLPVGVERFTLLGAPGGCLWSHAVLRPGNGTHQQTLKADLRLIGEGGGVVAAIEGLLMQRAVPATLLRSKRELLQHWLYEVAWRARPVDIAPAAKAPRGWLILADRGGVGERLATLLRAQGCDCVTALLDDAASDADFARLLAHCDRSLPEDRGVVHLWSLDAEGLSRACEIGCGTALRLVRGLLAQWKRAPTLWLVTSEAHIEQSPLRGLAQVVAWEHPELGTQRIAVDARTPAQAAADLFDEIRSGPSGEEQVAFRAGGRYVARLVRGEAPPNPASELFHGDATYLVTGGLGRLGMVIAEWMVNRGARHLVLAGRHTPSGAAEERIRALERGGAHVAIAQADVSDPHDVERVLREIAAGMPPLKGVWHLAGVVDDGVVQQQTWKRFSAVLAPKVQGAWHLHNLTRELPLEQFVLFSSVASLLGSPGQASHAAANAFLDALAHHRRARGLAALSVNWGPWAGLGPALGGTPKAKGSRMEGIGSFTADQGLAILEHLLADPPAQTGVVPIVWPRFLRQFAPRPFLSELAEASAVQPESSAGILDRLEQAAAAERLAMLAAHVKSQVAAILGLAPAEPVDAQKGLFTMGLDSLASLVLRNRLQSSLQCPLPATLVFNYPNVDALTQFLARTKLAALFEPEAAQAASLNGDSQFAAEIDRMSHQDVAALLARRIASAG